jgi:hypothetical protein
MRRMGSGIVVAALIGAFAVFAAPAAAESCNDGKVTVGHCGGGSSHHASSRTTHEFAAQTSRPRVTIYPRRQQLTANSVRQCRAQMVKEYRPSGTVVVPRMQCWWE